MAIIPSSSSASNSQNYQSQNIGQTYPVLLADSSVQFYTANQLAQMMVYPQYYPAIAVNQMSDTVAAMDAIRTQGDLANLQQSSYNYSQYVNSTNQLTAAQRAAQLQGLPTLVTATQTPTQTTITQTSASPSSTGWMSQNSTLLLLLVAMVVVLAIAI